MRRKDREAQTPEEVLDILDRCDTLRVGFSGETYPYIVPLSFGWEEIDERVYLYVHGAREGLRHDMLKNDGRVCVEADRFGGYVETPQGISCVYESVIGFGRAQMVEGEEALHGLRLLLKHCGYVDAPAFEQTAMHTCVWRITLSQLTGKRRRA